MPCVHFTEFDGTQHEVDVPNGTSLMRGARANGIPGIDADCGGEAACATCRVDVASEWMSHVGVAASGSLEDSMLMFVEDREETSRLSCQIVMRDDLDGIVVHLPEYQH